MGSLPFVKSPMENHKDNGFLYFYLNAAQNTFGVEGVYKISKARWLKTMDDITLSNDYTI